MLMQVRLSVLDYWKTEEGMRSQQQSIVRPVFIVGLPRTGTSMMHKMLFAGGQERWRTPLHWELLAPVPRPEIPQTRVRTHTCTWSARKLAFDACVRIYVCHRQKLS